MIYVTEICKCSQQSKQNAQGVLRPGDFFDNLKYKGRFAPERKVTVDNNKNRQKDRPKTGPEKRSMKPRENADIGLENGRKIGTHDGGHEKNGRR